MPQCHDIVDQRSYERGYANGKALAVMQLLSSTPTSRIAPAHHPQAGSRSPETTHSGNPLGWVPRSGRAQQCHPTSTAPRHHASLPA
jgi:hypothetical protein